VRAPESATSGDVTVRLSFEGWPEGEVRPATFHIPVVPRKAVTPVAVSPRQKNLWRLSDGFQPRQIVALPDGRLFAMASRFRGPDGDGYRLSIWNGNTGREGPVLVNLVPNKQTHQSLGRLILSPDGRWLLVSATRDGGTQTGPGGDLIYVTTGTIYLIDLGAHKVAREIPINGLWSSGLAFSPDSRIVAAALTKRVDHVSGEKQVTEWSGEVRLLETASGRLLKTLPSTKGEGPSGLTFAPSNNIVAVSYTFSVPDRQTARERLRLWDWERGAVLDTISDLWGMEFSTDGRALVAHSDRERIVVRDLVSKNERELFTCDPAKDWIRVKEAFWDDQFVVCATRLGRVTSIDLSSGKLLARKDLEMQNGREVSGAARSPKGRLLGLSTYSQPPRRISGTMPEDWADVPPPEILILDPLTLQPMTTLTGHVGGVIDLLFARDGNLVTAGNDGTIRVWDLSDLAPAK
jgi:WD40 repeat protein